jgi:hypothetical protein
MNLVLTPWTRILLQKLIVAPLFKLLLCSQEPDTGHYTEPDTSSPQHPALFLEIYLNTLLPSTARSPKWAHPFTFSEQTFHAFLMFHI